MLMLSNAILKPRERQNEEWLKNNKKMPKSVSRAATVYRQQLKENINMLLYKSGLDSSKTDNWILCILDSFSRVLKGRRIGSIRVLLGF